MELKTKIDGGRIDLLAGRNEGIISGRKTKLRGEEKEVQEGKKSGRKKSLAEKNEVEREGK